MYVFVCLRWHERVEELPEGKTTFRGPACRYYCYKSDLPHRWEQQIVNTHAHKHTLTDFIDSGKVLLPISAWYSSPATFWSVEELFQCTSPCLSGICVMCLCMHMCAYVWSYLFVCMCVCVLLGLLVSMCAWGHWYGLFTQLRKQIALCLVRDVQCSNRENKMSLNQMHQPAISDTAAIYRAF